MIIQGSDIARELREEMRCRIAGLTDAGRRAPCLAIVLAGDDAASAKYVANKLKAAEAIGMTGRCVRLPQDVSQEAVTRAIEELNADDAVDGIIVQLPVPEQLDAEAVIACISPEKDADGLHPVNEARLWRGEDGIRPCTPQGVVYLLNRIGIEIEGKRAVVVGRGDLVGKPLGKMLLNRNGTVTFAHSFTRNLPKVCREADIVVSAAGCPGLITADCVREGAAVIDVGISRLSDGKPVGDVCFEEVAKKAAYITPVPGGVGPMTVAMLLRNALQCYLKKMNKLTKKH